MLRSSSNKAGLVRGSGGTVLLSDSRRHMIGLFFFSSRRRHTRCSRDWSSDVCSSDLYGRDANQFFSFLGSTELIRGYTAGSLINNECAQGATATGVTGCPDLDRLIGSRSEERRVGKSVDLGGRRIIKKKNIKESTQRA